MKKLLFMVLIALMPIGLQAQEGNEKIDNSKQDIIYKTVPKKWFNIKDKIIVQNKSPYYILQVVVAVEDSNGDLRPLGSSSYLAPNGTSELASFRDNSLKALKGKVIAIKAKGTKVLLGDNSQAADLNNIKPSDITYDFDVRLSQSRHDLYIELFSINGQDVMDF